MLVYTCVLLLSPGRRFFGLSALDWKDFAIIGVAVLAWTVTLRWIWRSRVLDRFLSADFDLD
jgi:cation-transporting ATPase E